MPNQYPIPPGTELESDEEVTKIQAELRQLAKQTVAQKKSVSAEHPYRPTVRPPVAILCICDDGESDGERIRLKGDKFVIGRTEGDFQISHDEQVSSRHLSITRQTVAGKLTWIITDLQSRNGLFIRVGKAPIGNLNEVLIGAGKYRLEAAGVAAAETAEFGEANVRVRTNTQAFDNNMAIGSEVLSEIVKGGVASRIVLSRSQYWIGRDQDCDICRPNDPFTAGKHAVLTRSPKGTWVIQNNRTFNGVWVRMPQVSVEQGKGCEFMIGEQRLRFNAGASQ